MTWAEVLRVRWLCSRHLGLDLGLVGAPLANINVHQRHQDHGIARISTGQGKQTTWAEMLRVR